MAHRTKTGQEGEQLIGGNPELQQGGGSPMKEPLDRRALLNGIGLAVGAAVAASAASSFEAAAQQAAAPSSGPTPYGAPISSDAAKKALAAAEAEAKKNNWPVAIAILDTTGSLSAFLKLDNTQTASVDIAIGKARTALEFRRPTKALQDTIAAGGAGLRLLSVPGAYLLEGGVLIVADGKIVGAIGVSGVTSEQDAMVAMAGAAAAAA
jgi:glc operon protein GlcG